MFAIVICLVLLMCTLCSVLCVIMVKCMSVVVNVILSLMSVMRSLPVLCNLSVFALRLCGWEWVGELDQGLGGWGVVMYVCVVSLDSLWRWQVQVLCIVLGRYLRILSAPSVQSCCTSTSVSMMSMS